MNPTDSREPSPEAPVNAPGVVFSSGEPPEAFATPASESTRPNGVEAPDPRSSPSLSLVLAVRAFALLFGEGMSLGLFAWAVGSGPNLLPYALDNRVPLIQRTAVLGAMFGTGAFFMLLGAGYLAFNSRPNLERLHQIGLRLAPLFLAGFLPFLFKWQLWQSRELTFGVLVTALGFGVHAMILASLRAEPLFGDSSVRWSRTWSRLGRKLEPWLPTVLVLVGVLGYTLYFSYHTIANHRNLRSASFDLGLEENLIWNLIHGGQFMKSSPLVGPTGSHFGYHATFFAYVIGGIYALYQRPETLLAFQSFMIGVAAVPLYWLGRRYVGTWAAALVALAYLLYPPAHGSNLYDFHYLPLGVFFLWLTLYLVESRRYRWAALAVILTLSIREDVSAALIIVGAYLIFSGRNAKGGLVVAAVAAVYFFILKMVVMPRWLHGDSSFIHQYQGLLPSGERGYGGVLKTVVANPVFTLTSLLEEQKFLYLVQLASPLALFPWRRPIGWLCTLPGFFFTLLATGYLPLIQISFQYTAHWSSFLFVAVLANLAWVRRPKFSGDTQGAKRQQAWLATIALLTLFTSYQYGAILQTNTVKGGFGSYTFGTTDEDRARYAKLKRLIAKVPPRAKIVSSENIVPHIANRPDSYTLRVGLFDADWVLASLPASGEEATTIREAFKAGFGVVEIDGQFMLAKRGYSQKKNAEALTRIH